MNSSGCPLKDNSWIFDANAIVCAIVEMQSVLLSTSWFATGYAIAGVFAKFGRGSGFETMMLPGIIHITVSRLALITLPKVLIKIKNPPEK